VPVAAVIVLAAVTAWDIPAAVITSVEAEVLEAEAVQGAEALEVVPEAEVSEVEAVAVVQEGASEDRECHHQEEVLEDRECHHQEEASEDRECHRPDDAEGMAADVFPAFWYRLLF
jgi:hypothetical protein